jgi:hypothetical protein
MRGDLWGGLTFVIRYWPITLQQYHVIGTWSIYGVLYVLNGLVCM